MHILGRDGRRRWNISFRRITAVDTQQQHKDESGWGEEFF